MDKQKQEIDGWKVLTITLIILVIVLSSILIQQQFNPIMKVGDFEMPQKQFNDLVAQIDSSALSFACELEGRECLVFTVIDRDEMVRNE